MAKGKKRESTSISLYPLRFDEAVRVLLEPPTHEGSEVEVSGNATVAAPESVPSRRRTAPRRKSSVG